MTRCVTMLASGGSTTPFLSGFVRYGRSTVLTSVDLRVGMSGLPEAFRSSGGVMSTDVLTMLLRERCDQPISLLARWLVNRDVISFKRNGQTLLPAFQFDGQIAAVRPCVLGVLAELRGLLNDDEIAEWFAQPNSRLFGDSPVTLIDKDSAAVLDAARMDRFLAMGWPRSINR
jgi:hypothetical protein